jgi:hypothetical protein
VCSVAESQLASALFGSCFKEQPFLNFVGQEGTSLCAEGSGKIVNHYHSLEA